MNNSHFSFRFFPRADNSYFLPSDYVKGMSRSVKSEFDPYKDYELNYRLYSIWGLSKSNPNLEEDPAFFGTLNIRKSVTDNKAEYSIKRKVRGIMNNQNDAKPESIAIYTLSTANDMLCSIPPESNMHYKYNVERKYYNNDIAGIYSSEENIYIDKDKNIFIGLEASKSKLGQALNKLFTDFSLLDALQKVTLSEEKQKFNMCVDMLENMEVLKTDLNIKYIQTIQGTFDGYITPLFGYCMTGTAVTPTIYWVTAKGLLIAVRKGATFMVLTDV